MRAGIIYTDGRGKIIDTEDGTIIFEFKDDGVKNIDCSSNQKKAVISYKDGRWEIIDFADYNRGINFVQFNSEQLLFSFNLSKNLHYLNHVEDKDDARRIWQSFVPELQQKLKESYFPKVDFLSLEQE